MPPLNQTEVLGQAVAFVNAVADVMNVDPPKVTLGTDQPANVCGQYAPASRTISVITTDDLANTLLHEFQHHLDELYGRELRGALRGTHDSGFYHRLDGLKEIVARELG